jgi:hypothetical protein
MVGLAVRQHLSIGDVQGRKQRRGPVTDVIVGDALNVAEPHGQHGLRAFQSLTLALLVHTQNQRIFWRIEVQPDHIPYLLHEQRIGRQLEGFLPMRLQTER